MCVCAYVRFVSYQVEGGLTQLETLEALGAWVGRHKQRLYQAVRGTDNYMSKTSWCAAPHTELGHLLHKAALHKAETGTPRHTCPAPTPPADSAHHLHHPLSP
jgi:hypothetical protein